MQDSHKSFSVAIAHIPKHVTHVTSPSVSTPLSHDYDPYPNLRSLHSSFYSLLRDNSRHAGFTWLYLLGLGACWPSHLSWLYQKGFWLISFTCHLEWNWVNPFVFAGSFYALISRAGLAYFPSVFTDPEFIQEFLFLTFFVFSIFQMFLYGALKSSYNIPLVVVLTSEREQVELPLGVLYIHFLLFNRCSDSSLRPGQQSTGSLKSKVLNATALQKWWWRSLLSKPVSERGHHPSSWFPLESFLVQRLWQ